MLAEKRIPVTMLARGPEEAAHIEVSRENRRVLPGILLPDGLNVVADIEQAISPSGLVVFAVPSHRLRENAAAVRAALSRDACVVSATKGLELATGKRMSQVLDEELPSHVRPGICVLSGPNLAKEILQGKFSATVVAGCQEGRAEYAQSALMSSSFRVYTSDDVIGVELAGALKNIIALGAGISDGLDLGDNAKSAFITRGLAEITRLGIAAGAQPLTFAGLAGMGDIIATCSSPLSRNRYVGEQLARGKSWPEIRESMDNVAEGVNTTGAAVAMAEELGVEMPITDVTYRMLFEGLPPKEAIAELMGRPPRSEW
jgi:glycerol-3-phosphate dehydrogenase (NAD(P)+)